MCFNRADEPRGAGNVESRTHYDGYGIVVCCSQGGVHYVDQELCVVGTYRVWYHADTEMKQL